MFDLAPQTITVLAFVIPTVISLLAVAVTSYGLYLQFVRVRGASVILVDDGRSQRCVVYSFEQLPESIRRMFPQFHEKYPGYIAIDLPFANPGDRTGFVRVEGVRAENAEVATLEEDAIHASFYEYMPIPPGDIVVHRILVRNIPPITSERNLPLAIDIEWGGISRKGKYEAAEPRPYKLQVTLAPYMS